MKEQTHVKVARVNKGSVLIVCVPKVLEGDVVDKAIADIGPSPGLDPRAVLPVQHPHVFDVHVTDEALLSGVLADAAHADAVGSIAVHVPHDEVGAVGLWAEAVVADVDPGTFDVDVFDVERIEEVRVLWESGCVVGLGGACDVLEGDELGWLGAVGYFPFQNKPNRRNLQVTKKVVQQGESLRWIPSIDKPVAFSA